MCMHVCVYVSAYEYVSGGHRAILGQKPICLFIYHTSIKMNGIILALPSYFLAPLRI